jgi:hypothetical protein
MKRSFLILLCFVFSSAIAHAGGGLSYDPQDGSWLPAGTTGVFIYYGSAWANKMYSNGDKVTSAGNLDSQIAVARIATWQDFGIPMQFSLLVPYGKVSLDGAGSSSGTGDMQFDYSARVLHWEQGYVNIGLTMTAPTGEYDQNSALNLGTNRWMFRPVIGGGHNVGPVHFDLFGGYEFYTDNNDYLAGGALPDSRTLEKDGAFFLETHISWFFLPESMTYVALSLGGKWGGEEKVDGTVIAGDNNIYTAQFTFGTNITDTLNLQVAFESDIKTDEGFKSNGVMLRLGKFF